jgi:hypothetical protein
MIGASNNPTTHNTIIYIQTRKKTFINPLIWACVKSDNKIITKNSRFQLFQGAMICKKY